ncbi:OsmC family protein [Cyanobium sp. N.Huapi 1H5]|uniref:OsmC family protein n=1 Tax=Cyanobium sp. N.Huapi 1H5 TaxID=2823719 RepID=UPI0020CCB76D|nr:OsmC family protein [Cyanobium sp. N.Huapi 1H5]MCP9838389.1 OsmC family protein [Cyanobium sp. N.Huapi 1H5]
MTTMTCRYEGALRCAAEHAPSGSQLITDAPVDNQGKGEAFSPTDLVATALATCLLTVMGIVAEREGMALEGARVRVEKGMTSTGERRIALLEAWIDLPAGLDDGQRQVLIRAGERCPVKVSLEGCVPMHLHWNPATAG